MAIDNDEDDKLNEDPADAAINVCWEPVPGATHYLLWYDDDDGRWPPFDPPVYATEGAPPLTVHDTRCWLTGLTPGVRMRVSVQAVAAGTAGPHGWAFATPWDPKPPTLLAVTPGVASLALSWTAADQAQSYNIYYDDDPANPWDPAIGNVALGGGPPIRCVYGTSYVLRGCTPGVAYRIAVSANRGWWVQEGALSGSLTATPAGTVDDAFEPNDTPATAATLGSGSQAGLVCVDPDCYAVTLGLGDCLSVRLAFVHALGNLDLEVLDPSQSRIAWSPTIRDVETVQLHRPGAGTYTIRVYPAHARIGNAYTLDVLVYNPKEDWEAGLLGTIPAWVSGGSPGGWSIQSSLAAGRYQAARSGPTPDDGSSYLELTAAHAPGALSFHFAVDADAGDGLYFLVDGAVVGQWTATVPWQWVTYQIPAGKHTYRWEYRKNSGGWAGNDCAWLDDICFPGPLTVTDDLDSGRIPLLPLTPTTPSAPWFTTATTAFSGIRSGRSWPMTSTGSPQASTFQLVLPTAAGQISFAYAVDSQPAADGLLFWIDGQPMNGLTPAFSGPVPWTVVTFPISAGLHTFQWSYVKDGAIDFGVDAAWVDDITIPLP